MSNWTFVSVYAWEFPGVAGNAWNGEPVRSIAIGSGCIWSEFIFLATERPGDCMEMLLECLRNPRPTYLERSEQWRPPWTVEEESEKAMAYDESNVAGEHESRMPNVAGSSHGVMHRLQQQI
eukprot:Gb_29306 [translate_table: standard]